MSEHRIFLAGLMDWSGSGPPTSQALAGCAILAQGSMHVAAISDTASLILGRRDLELDGLTGLREVTHRAGGTVWLYQDGQRAPPGNHGRAPHAARNVGLGSPGNPDARRRPLRAPLNPRPSPSRVPVVSSRTQNGLFWTIPAARP